MTVPITPGLPASPPPPPASPPSSAFPLSPPVQESFQFPLSWLLDNSVAPIQYRATTEVARLAVRDAAQFSTLPYSYGPALLLALLQEGDGSWGHAILTVPSVKAANFEGVGTVSAVQRLLEYGWDRDAPPLLHARRILFRLLAEDDDPAYLFELGNRGKMEPEAIRHGRGILREAAASALAQAGYENDPRLRGAARRIVERVDAYLRSPIAEKPFVRSGNQHVLAAEAAPPSVYMLSMLAYMPHFRNERYDIMERLYGYLTQPQPRAEPASVVGKKIVAEPHLVLGDPLPHRSAADADLPVALRWLELFARLGLLRRSEGWTRVYDRLLDDRDNLGVWRTPKRAAMMRTASAFAWPGFPLEPHAAGDALSAEVTLRLGLIARYAGRQIELS